jgi:hypothetical protein
VAPAALSLAPTSVHLRAEATQPATRAGTGTAVAGAGERAPQALPPGGRSHGAVAASAGSAAPAPPTPAIRLGQAPGRPSSGTRPGVEEAHAQSAARPGAGAHLRPPSGAGAGAVAHATTRAAAAQRPIAPTRTNPSALPALPPAAAHFSSGGGQDLPALELGPAASQALQVLLIVLGATLLAGLLFADELRLGERYRDLRTRLSQRRSG